MIHGFIFARGGSKGLPGKNIKLFAGKPLIAYAIQQARDAGIDNIAVSTDSDQIADIALNYGAIRIIKRPDYLTSDNSPEWFSWQHAVTEIGMAPDDIFLSIPCTCPLRLPGDISDTLNALNETYQLAVTVRECHEVIIDENFQPLIKVAPNRQDRDKLWSVVGSCYATRASFILNNNSIWDAKYTAMVEVPHDRAVDIDTQYDFDIAEMLYKRRFN